MLLSSDQVMESGLKGWEKMKADGSLSIYTVLLLAVGYQAATGRLPSE